MTPQSQGRDFEKELAKEFGLEQVPSSGSVWHSKLDLKGHKFRWSLKFTIRKIWPFRYIDMEEDIRNCLGPGGDGSSPIWAARTPLGDFIIMRKEDFKLMQTDHVKLIAEDRPQVVARKKRASQPELLREDEPNGNWRNLINTWG